MTVPERLSALRKCMEEKNIDVYVVPTADFHQSEYVGEHFKARKFITGFSGSAGTAVITKTEARLWTDGRYFIQAAAQLKGTTVELMKMGEPGVPGMNAYIEEVLKEGETLGFDGRVVSVGEGEGYAAIAGKKNAKVNYQVDLIDEIWEDRPVLSEEPAFNLDVKYAGETVASKLARIREEMKEAGTNVHVVSTIDDICWTLNIRGNDIDFFPLVLSYGIITMDSFELYIDEKKLDDKLKAKLAKDGVNLHPYNDIYEDVKKFGSDVVAMIDPGKLNYALFNNIPENVKTVEKRNPAILMKAIKNPVEIENIRKKLPLIYEYLDRVLINTTSQPTLYAQLQRNLVQINSLKEPDLCSSDIVRDRVFISTVHKAKGLEFDNVIVTSVIDGTYPFFKNHDKADILEDARKLYVAISRTKRTLVLTMPAANAWNYAQRPSRFLESISTYFEKSSA